MAVTGPKTGFRTDLISAPGGLFTWGSNLGGQLGNGTTVASTFPTPVTTNYSWLSADMGGLANSDQAVGAAVRSDGTLWTWGFNSKGSLGLNIPDNSNVYYSSPIQVGSLNDWKQVSISRVTNTCMLAVKKDGTLWAWGSDAYGMIGNGVSGSTIKYSSPVQVGSLSDWSQVSAKSDHVRAIKTDGTLWTWGINSYGGLGNGTTINYLSPIQVGTGTNWKQVATGTYFGGAVKTDGTLWMWGRNTYGQLGNGTSSGISGYSSPIQVGLLTNWSQVSCGEENTSAVKTDGTLWGWGRNYYGVIGNGTSIDYSSPIQIGSLTNWSEVSTSATTTAAIKTDGTLWGCGYKYVGAGTNSGFTYSPVQLGSLSNWTDVSAHGAYNSIAISVPQKDQKTYYTNSPVVCGYNITGNLGNSTTTDSNRLSNFNGSNQYSQIDCGKYQGSTIGIRTDGTLWACGYNVSGGLGNGTTVYYSSPIQIGALTNWKQVSTRGSSTAAIKTDGTLWTWGYGLHGSLGNDQATSSYSSPIQVGLLTNWSQVTFAGVTCLAVKTNGTLWAWGLNIQGELGNGTVNTGSGTNAYSSPIQIGSLTNWKSATTSENSFSGAIKTDGTLWVWGSGQNGQLGNGSTSNYSSPIQIGSLTNWSQISSSTNSTAAIKTDGTLWTWGDNTYGNLGNGSTLSYSSPIQIGSLTNWKQVVCGPYYKIAVKTDGTLWGWGSNSRGQLGFGSIGSMYSSPVQIGSLNIWSSVAAGSYATAVIASGNGTDTLTQDLGDRYVSKDYLLDVYPQIASATGARTSPGLWTWGLNAQGQLGNGTLISYSSPIQIGSLTNWSQISPALGSAAAIKTDGTLWGWGSNQFGELGSGNAVSYSSPIQIGSLTNWKQISKGFNWVCAIKTDGTLWSWGRNIWGQLGNGTAINYSSPIQIGSLTNWKQVSTSLNSSSAYVLTLSAAIKTDGTLWTWGADAYGQLGNGTAAPGLKYSSPIQVGALTNWKQVSAGGYNWLALKTDGTLWTCGYNPQGQLGNGNTINYSSPIQIGSLNTWKQVSCRYYSVAIKTDGTLWAWGRNDYGQLGNGTNGNKYSSPIQVGALTNWKQVSASQEGWMAIKTDGTLWACGRNEFGQLGNQTIISYSSPIQIGSLSNWKSIYCGYVSSAIADGYY